MLGFMHFFWAFYGMNLSGLQHINCVTILCLLVNHCNAAWTSEPVFIILLSTLKAVLARIAVKIFRCFAHAI